MKIKKAVIITAIITVFGILFITLNFSQKSISIADKTPVEKTAEFTEIEKNDTFSKTKISYQLPVDNPILTINSPQILNLDFEHLKKELSKDNVGIDIENEAIHINLKNNISDKGQGSFWLQTTNNNPTNIILRDIENNNIQETILNETKESTEENTDSDKEQESVEENIDQKTNDLSDSLEPTETNDLIQKNTNETNNNSTSVLTDDENDSQSGWARQGKLGISLGKPIQMKDKTIYPAIYFGAINYSLGDGLKVSKSVGGRPRIGITPFHYGTGRMNNITAANSAIIITKNGNDPNNEQHQKHDYDKDNEWYTNTFGDGLLTYTPGLLTGVLTGSLVQEYFGSQRNFTTTNLYDYTQSTGNFEKPNLVGPDADLKGEQASLGMDKNSVKYYVKKDDASGLWMQRMVFDQQGTNHRRVRIKTTQRFDQYGSVVVTTEFKNVGTSNIPHFSGYTFRDITFMKNHEHGNDQGTQNKRESTNILRSLGDNRGLYAARKSLNGSIEFHFD